MSLAQSRYEHSANRNREPSPMYQVSDEVWLSTRNIKTLRPSRKLDWKRIGRFSIKRIMSPYAYELDLPDTMRMHQVFHVSLLDPVATDPMPGQSLPPPSPVEVDEDNVTTGGAEDILDAFHRLYPTKPQTQRRSHPRRRGAQPLEGS